MRRPKPALMAVLVLAGAVALVSCSGADDAHKEKKQVVKPPAGATTKPAPSSSAAPGKPVDPVENKPVELGGKNDGKTINFSSGKPVVTDTPEDRVAIRSALKDFAVASKGVTFGPPKKKPVTPPDAAKN
jgi:hypothetical protein